MPRHVEYDALAQFKAPSSLLEQVKVAAGERCMTFSEFARQSLISQLGDMDAREQADA